MLTTVQRIILKAKPSKSHPHFNEWETVTLVYLIDESNKSKAIEIVRQNMSLNHWEILYYESKSTLIEEMIQNAKKEFIDAYFYAKKNKIYLKVFHDNFMPGKKNSQHFCPPLISEKFIDDVIFDAGGRRLNPDEKRYEEELNADYIIDNYVFELKNLMEEGLDKLERRKKISDLFRNYYRTDEPILINPEILSKSDKLKYTSIITTPLEKRIKKAFNQAYETRERISNDYKIGLIYVNSGYFSIPHDVFTAEVKRYITKNNLVFDEVITFSVSAQTNGFDMSVVFPCDPQDSKNIVTNKILDSWNSHSEKIMTSLLLGEVKDFTSPQKPVSFNFSGIDFYWLPYAIERFSFNDEK
ncbi:MAG: hypothetical protein MUO34_01830 [Ignavibacteriaceae bacterium]|nr:hypothetical protein [Ignavibacteriaceae bacterium]